MDPRIEYLLQRMGELLQTFNGHPEPEQEEDGQKELLTSFQELQHVAKEDTIFETTNHDFLHDMEDLLTQIKEWDPLESWFNEKPQLQINYNTFLQKYTSSIPVISPKKSKSTKKVPSGTPDQDMFLDEVESDLTINAFDEETKGKVNRRISNIEEKLKQFAPKDLSKEDAHLPPPVIHLQNIAQDTPPLTEKNEQSSSRSHFVTEIAIDMEQLKKIPVKKGQAPPISPAPPTIKQTQPKEKRPTEFERILPQYVNPVPLRMEHAPVPTSPEPRSEIKQLQYRAVLDSNTASPDLPLLFQTEIKNRGAEDLFQALLYWESQDYYIHHEMRQIQAQLQQGTLNAAAFDHLKGTYDRGLEKTQNAIKMIKANIK